MSWGNSIIAQSADNSAYMEAFDTVANSTAIAAGASYSCNSTIFAQTLSLRNLGSGPVLLQSKAKASNFNAGGFPSFTITFDQPVQPGSTVVVMFAASFLFPLFNIRVTDNHQTGTEPVYVSQTASDGHVPGESFSAQIWFQPKSPGGSGFTITITQTGVDNMTTIACVIREYSGLNLAAVTDGWSASTGQGTGSTIIDGVGNEEKATSGGVTGVTEPDWTGGNGNTFNDNSVLWTCQGPDPAAVSGGGFNYTVGGPASVTLNPTPANIGDLVLFGVFILPACLTPNVIPSGGGSPVVAGGKFLIGASLGFFTQGVIGGGQLS